jgi:hypothetical protein
MHVPPAGKPSAGVGSVINSGASGQFNLDAPQRRAANRASSIVSHPAEAVNVTNLLQPLKNLASPSANG